MEIGKEEETVTVEPILDPVRKPEREREVEPVKAPKREKVPA